MADKGIGLIRTVALGWLDSTAAFVAEHDDIAAVRARLHSLLEREVQGVVARRKTVDVLVGIWFKSGRCSPALRADAVRLFGEVAPSERVWLHFGLTLLFSAFFRECAAVVGQTSRRGEPIRSAGLRQHMATRWGQFGALERAVQYALLNMRRWGLLDKEASAGGYSAPERVLVTDRPGLQAWLLGCALKAHPGQEMPVLDLVRLPELFPFRITLEPDGLRRDGRFRVERMGQGWDSVRVVV